MLMQELWKAKVGWDDPLSPEFQKKWEAIQQSLQALPTYNIRRVYSNSKTGSTDETEFHLHVFCDASAKAYSACAYMVAIQGDFVSVDLVFAKSRVAPVKELTIPKLELTAVVMGTRIVQFVEQHMNIKFSSKFIWTDSMCTLSWILGDKVTTSFVQSRVREIRSVSGLEFRFVPSEMNPADLGSRGVPFSTLKEKDLWWKGPPWLHQELKWPPQDKIPISMPKPASEDVAVASIAHSPDPDSLLDLKRFSSLKQLLRVSVWVFRACVRFKKKKAPCGSMSAKELDNALDFWEKRIQAHHFNPLLRDSKEPQWKAFSKQLGLFIDTKGIIRCRGRFNFSESLEEGAKFPILLPKSSEFTRLVIEDCHRKSLHFGVKHTLAKLRERFWICQGRSQVKSVLLQCQVCRRYGGGPFQVPDPAPLPSFRASIKRPFACVGLDYLGPLFVRAQPDSKKVWICLITCAVSRAVHLEVVSSLSAADFLLCLRRFVSIHGKPDIIVSDNARQFKAADQMLQKEFKRLATEQEVQDFISGSGISWEFIVEKSPWMGGFYERLVAVVKEALKKSLGRWTVTQEELQTLCYEVAFVVNSRPLIYSEDDPSDKVLTPSDLLFKSVNCFPDGSGEQVFQADMSKADELLLHWKAGQNLLRQFWDAWRDHYLVALRDFDRVPKGRGASPIAVDLGVVVLIKDNLPRGQWKVGRISKLRASHDGEIRAAEAMPHVIEIVPGHPLSPTHTHRELLTLKDVRVASVRQGFHYIKLLHHGKPDAARELLADQAMTWNPERIQPFSQKHIPQDNVNFVVKTDEIMRAILIHQLEDPRNPFRLSLEAALKPIPKAERDDVEFRVYTSHKDMVLTSGFRYGDWKDTEEMPGFNVYGDLLAELARIVNRNSPVDNSLLDELLTNFSMFKPHISRSFLLISDSQHRLMKGIEAGGDVIPVSEGKYQHMIDVLSAPRFDLSEYKWIGIYCGINCKISPNYTFAQRNEEWLKLKSLLVDEAARRDKPSVIFCCSFDHPTANPGNPGHAAFIQRQLEGTGVLYVDWHRLGNPLLLRNGLLNYALFNVFNKNPRQWHKEIHINHKGLRVVWKAFCYYLKGLKFIHYTENKTPQSVAKSVFEPLPALPAPNSDANMPGPSNLRITVPLVPSKVSLPSTNRRALGPDRQELQVSTIGHAEPHGDIRRFDRKRHSDDRNNFDYRRQRR